MTLTPLLLLGAGGHAAACIDVIEQEGRFSVAGLVAASKEVGKEVLGCRVVGTDADLPQLVAQFRHAFIAVGQIKSAEPRVRLFVRLLELGCTVPTIISPRSYVSPHATIGRGTIVMHGATVNARARVGDDCIINTDALVEHDAVIGDHCHVSTAAVLNGEVRVGARTFIGSGAVIRECVDIGERCIVGMGQRILANCASGARIPARRPA